MRLLVWERSTLRASLHRVNDSCNLTTVSRFRLVTFVLEYTCSLLTILQARAQGSSPLNASPELMSVDREINVLQSCLLSKHFVSKTSFRYIKKNYVCFSFQVAIDVVFIFITTVSVDSSSLLVRWPNHRIVAIVVCYVY